MSDVTMDDFRVGAVLGRSFSVLSRNFVAFMALALAFNAPLYLYQLLADPGDAVGTEDLPVGVLLLLLGQMLLSFLLTATLVYGTVRDLRGRPAGLGECIAQGVALLLPVFLVAVLATLALMVGFMLFIVPGIVLMVFWWVLIPTVVVERPGLLRAFGRSMELTKGYRWRVFALFLVIVVGYIVIGMVVGAASFGALFSTTDLENLEAATRSSFDIFVLIDWLLSSLLAAFWSVMAAVSYHDLRIAQEGADSNEIAAVFD